MLEELITEIKKWEGSKGIAGRKSRLKELRQKLNESIADGIELKEVGNWVLVKQYNPVLDKSFWAIYSKGSFNKWREFLKNNY